MSWFCRSLDFVEVFSIDFSWVEHSQRVPEVSSHSCGRGCVSGRANPDIQECLSYQFVRVWGTGGGEG